MHDRMVRSRFMPHSFSPPSCTAHRREEENCRREAAANKISSLKNPGALSRGHLINNDVEKPARRCSLGRAGRGAWERDEERKQKLPG